MTVERISGDAPGLTRAGGDLVPALLPAPAEGELAALYHSGPGAGVAFYDVVEHEGAWSVLAGHVDQHRADPVAAGSRARWLLREAAGAPATFARVVAELNAEPGLTACLAHVRGDERAGGRLAVCLGEPSCVVLRAAGGTERAAPPPAPGAPGRRAPEPAALGFAAAPLAHAAAFEIRARDTVLVVTANILDALPGTDAARAECLDARATPRGAAGVVAALERGLLENGVSLRGDAAAVALTFG